MLLVGIDEAGYGPLLGPLVVSAVRNEIPDEHATGSLWKLFAAGLTDKTSKIKRQNHSRRQQEGLSRKIT